MSDTSIPDWAKNIPPYRVRCPEEFPAINRIISRQELLETVASIRIAGLSIALTSGSFDLTHFGHAAYLENAAQQADILIVGLDSDEKVRHRKGPDRPWYSELERAYMVANCRKVDWVTVKQVNEPKWSLIRAVGPDVLVLTGETYTAGERQELSAHVGSIVVLNSTEGISTSRRISQLHARHMVNKLDIDHEQQQDQWP